MGTIQRITIDPARRDGEPCIRDLGIAVQEVLELLAHGSTERDVLAEFPGLEPADIRACLEFARESSGGQERSSAPVPPMTSDAGLAARTEARRSRIVVHRARSHQEAEDWDLEFWLSRSPAERLAALRAIHEDVEKTRQSGR